MDDISFTKQFKFIGITFILSTFCFGCATDFPIKAVRDTSILTGETNDYTAVENADSSGPGVTKDDRQKTTDNSDKTAANREDAKASSESSTSRSEKIELGAGEMQKFAYELGFDPKKPLTEEQKKQIYNRKTLREMERALDSQKERQQYSKVLPWLKDDAEKIQLLSIPSLEGRQVWINKNKIWSRAKSLAEYDEIIESQDIAMGMPAEYVKKSWGEPDNVETSGNPIYRNERWQYNRQVSTPQGYKTEKRYVYFEGGRVVGWETE